MMIRPIEWRELYVYAFSAVGMIMMLIGSVALINYGVRIAFVPDYPIQNICYTDSELVDRGPLQSVEARPASTKSSLRDCTDQELHRNNLLRRERRVERIAGGVIILLIGLPLYWYHWRLSR